MRSAIALSVLLLAGCEKDYAEVQCAGVGDGSMSCTVHHTKGSRTIDVCFDVVIQCHNGTNASAHACQKSMAPAAAAVRILQDGDFSNAAKCDTVSGTSVTNMTLAEST